MMTERKFRFFLHGSRVNMGLMFPVLLDVFMSEVGRPLYRPGYLTSGSRDDVSAPGYIHHDNGSHGGGGSFGGSGGTGSW